MNSKIVKSTIFLLAISVCLGLSAQDEVPPTKRKPLTPEQHASKAKQREQRWKVKNKQDAELKAKAVDINHATKAELMKLTGITAEFADMIIAKRPFRSKAELTTRNVIPRGTYQGIHSQVVAK